MTREEIMEMAYESGVIGGYEGEPDLLERVAALVAAAERDACCRIVTGLCISDNNAREINEAIRGRA
jgi:hypothetical protein